jgi:hypothetical protein
MDTKFVLHYSRAMRNVTITLEGDVARWARIEAARNDTSLSRFVGEILRRRMEDEVGYESAMQQFLSREPTVLQKEGLYPAREELQDRSGLR